MNHPYRLLGALALLMTLLGACATDDFGDRARSEGNAKIQIGEDWEAGKRDAKEGEQQVRRGRKLVEKGRADLREGEREVAAGNLAVQTNREAYQALAQSPAVANSAEAARDRNAKLEKYAAAWKAGERRIENGNRLIRRGNDRIDEGEAEIAKGQRRIEAGRARMRKAEDAYESRN